MTAKSPVAVKTATWMVFEVKPEGNLPSSSFVGGGRVAPPPPFRDKPNFGESLRSRARFSTHGLLLIQAESLQGPILAQVLHLATRSD